MCGKREATAEGARRVVMPTLFVLLIAFAIILGDPLAQDLNVELHSGVSAEARCSARMSLRVRTWPALTTFMS